LRLAWQQGNYKLPIRLNFDEFEDKFIAITNQHFYGFEEMTFSPGAKDPSLIREKATSDIFRMAGIPAARTAFYRV
jgi:spore coat protein H